MLNPNPKLVYENLLEELAAGELTQLQRQIFELLRDNPVVPPLGFRKEFL